MRNSGTPLLVICPVSLEPVLLVLPVGLKVGTNTIQVLGVLYRVARREYCRILHGVPVEV
jgi:hypothetical protein